MHDQVAVALFVYNRVEHTKKTIESLLLNEVDSVVLYIFSDGPKESDIESVNAVRSYIAGVRGFSRVQLIERTENIGLANSIVEGITEVLQEHDAVIVLEDDLEVSEVFVSYMKNALCKYRDDPRVMSIAGYSYPMLSNDDPNVGDAYFLRHITSWGWATWASAWGHFRKDPDELLKEFSRAEINEFNFNGSENFWNQVVLNKIGVLNTWAIFWYAAVFKRNGLTLFPKISLVRNIGHDGSGTNCGESDRFNVELSRSPVSLNDLTVRESGYARASLEAFFRDSRPSFISRAFSF